MTRRDRFSNEINAGDLVVYYGTSLGLIIGVVVKLNPLSYKIKSKKTYGNNVVTFHYHNIPFSYSNNIAKIESLKGFKAEDFLDDVEKLRLGVK